MPAKVGVSNAALADLATVRSWLTQAGAGPRAAERLRRISAALRDLGRHALRWPEGGHKGVRERQVEGYRILYRVVSGTGDVSATEVRVARVLGPGQDRSALEIWSNRFYDCARRR